MLCFRADLFFLFNLENMQKENRFQTGKQKSFYTGNFKKK